jgi:hypothetical protein
MFHTAVLGDWRMGKRRVACLWLVVAAASALASGCATPHRSVDAVGAATTTVPLTTAPSDSARSEPSTTSPSTIAATTTSAWPPQAWAATNHCDGPSQRPAYVDVGFSYKSRPSWSYSEALAALRRHRLDTTVLERAGEARWKQHTQVPGTIGELLAGAHGLARDTRGADGYAPEVRILCAGLVSLVDDFSVEHDAGVTVQSLLARTGNQEIQRGEEAASSWGDNTQFVWVATNDRRFVIERLIAWLADPAVFGAQADQGCGRADGYPTGQTPPPPTTGCDTAVS